MTIEYLTGDALTTIRTLPDDSVDLVATSPPFLALRNYNDVDGQWGSEATPADFLDNLLTLAVECRRVLAPHGSLAWELGDTYSGKSGWGDDNGNSRYPNGRGVTSNAEKPNASGPGWPLSKSLTGVPTLFAWSLAYGRNLVDPSIGAERVEWICRLARLGISAPSADWLTRAIPIKPVFEPWRIRNVIVWARNNPPVGALGDKVRPATSYITVACPSGRRWFDLDAVRTEPFAGWRLRTATEGLKGPNNDRGDKGISNLGVHPGGAPPVDHWHDEYDGDLTWLINSAGSSLAHYAMWPAKLAERLILSMCPAEVCRECSEPRRRITDRSYVPDHSGGGATTRRDATEPEGNNRGINGGPRMAVVSRTLGWSDCGHNNWRPGHVLDPFAGTGTTLAVADIHGRDATGIDLDPDNAQLLPERYAEVWRNLKPTAGLSPVTAHGHQQTLI